MATETEVENVEEPVLEDDSLNAVEAESETETDDTEVSDSAAALAATIEVLTATNSALTTANEALLAEIDALKKVNAELLMTTPVSSNTEDDNDDVFETIDDLFG